MLSKNLKEHREAKNESQQQLAQQLGVAQSTIGMWETGKRRPGYETIQKLSEYYGVTIDALLGNDTKPEKTDINSIIKNATALFFDEEISDDDKEKLARVINDEYWKSKDKTKKQGE